MTAQILDGKIMSARIREDVARRTALLKEKGITPGLAVILVGNDPASEIYVFRNDSPAGVHLSG